MTTHHTTQPRCGIAWGVQYHATNFENGMQRLAYGAPQVISFWLPRVKFIFVIFPPINGTNTTFDISATAFGYCRGGLYNLNTRELQTTEIDLGCI